MYLEALTDGLVELVEGTAEQINATTTNQPDARQEHKRDEGEVEEDGGDLQHGELVHDDAGDGETDEQLEECIHLPPLDLAAGAPCCARLALFASYSGRWYRALFSGWTWGQM